MTVVNYKERPVAPLLFFLLFLLVALIGMPIWAVHELGIPNNPFATGKLVVAPLLGLFYLVIVVRTFRFNGRVRRDPRAIQWDARGISLWQNGREQRVPWSEVKQIAFRPGRRASDLSFLRIVTSKPNGGVMRWLFSSGRLQLSDHSLPAIAKLIEQARSGLAAAGIAAPAIDLDFPLEQRSEKVDTVRKIAAMIICTYFVTLAGMAIYLSSTQTTLLTPNDPRLWITAKLAFFATFALFLLWVVTATWKTPIGSAMAGALPPLFIVGATLAAVVAGWAYLATEVWVTRTTFSGSVEHQIAILSVKRDGRFRGQPQVRGHLRDRPGSEVSFVIDPADEPLIEAADVPGRREQPSCLAVPVEVAGQAIRATVREDTRLPAGSIRACA